MSYGCDQFGFDAERDAKFEDKIIIVPYHGINRIKDQLEHCKWVGKLSTNGTSNLRFFERAEAIEWTLEQLGITLD
jgi:hypothetical protein